MNKTDELYIFGTGGHARELAWIAQEAGWHVAGFLSPDATAGEHLGGIRIIPEDRITDLPKQSCAVIGIGAPDIRRMVAERWDLCFTWVTLCHPTATVARDATLGAGTVLFPQTVIGPAVQIGRHVVVNVGASVSHDGEIGDYALLGPGVRLAGHVAVGSGAYVGCGAVTRGGRPDVPLRIGHDAVVGAGAAVVTDIAPGVRVAGVPARPMRD